MAELKPTAPKKRSYTKRKQYNRNAKTASQSKKSKEVFSSGSKPTKVIAHRNDECEKYSFGILDELNFKYEVGSTDTQTPNLFIQDKLMQKFYQHYPESICIDILCKAPEVDQSLVLFIGVDSNGHCEIVSVGLLESGNADGFVWICDMFKNRNPNWTDIELILSDENYDRDILTKAFPGKLIFTSFFHSMKAFKKDLSSLDNADTDLDISGILQLFEKMMFITSESEYSEILKQMKQMNVQVFNLFKKKWHVRRDQWAIGLYTDSKVFLKAFNTYLLNIRRKLNSLVSCQESLENIIRNLHSTIYKLRKEWFQHFTKMLPSPTVPYLSISLMQKYTSFVTPFASELIYEQLRKSDDLKNVEKSDLQSYYIVNGTLASPCSCCCNFHKFMKLPCCHIFSVRKYLLLPLFVQSLRPSWIFENYCDTFFNFYSLHVLDHEKSRAAEMRHRYEEYVRTCHKLWSHIFNCSIEVSQQRLDIFQNILKAWKYEFEIDIIITEKQNDPISETLEHLPTDLFKELYGISINDIIDSENEFMDVPTSPENNTELF